MSEQENNNFERNIFERYKLLISARDFHYENFNKWLTYFYVANAAIFVGYIQLLISKETGNNGFDKDLASKGMLLFGWLAGILLHWSSKGYYYWNINYIMLVNYYEKSVLKWNPGESIYSSMANKRIQNDYFNPISGANYSTSKIALLFSFCIAVAWGTLTLYTLIPIPYMKEWLQFCEIFIYILGSSGIVILLGQITRLFTHFSKSKEQRREEAKIRKEQKNARKKYWFLASNTDPLDDLNINQM